MPCCAGAALRARFASASRATGESFAAHAWIEVGKDKLVGAREAEGYARLAAYGGAA